MNVARRLQETAAPYRWMHPATVMLLISNSTLLYFHSVMKHLPTAAVIMLMFITASGV